MAKFMTKLEVEEVSDSSNDGRGAWRLLQPLVYASDVLNNTVTVPTGFITDFASVPRLPFVFMFTGDSAHMAATVHDWLYASHMTTRSQADAVFREAAIETGVPKWRAWVMWAGVRVGGASHWYD